MLGFIIISSSAINGHEPIQLGVHIIYHCTPISMLHFIVERKLFHKAPHPVNHGGLLILFHHRYICLVFTAVWCPSLKAV